RGVTRANVQLVATFSCGCADLSVLHSFPTRRSSDLAAERSSVPDALRAAMTTSADVWFTFPLVEDVSIYTARTPAQQRVAARIGSVAHTSEVQSRFELVSRRVLAPQKPTARVRSPAC